MHVVVLYVNNCHNLILSLLYFQKINLDEKLNDISKDVDFSELCITSSAEVSYLKNSETKVQTIKAEGSKCQVCWKITKEACSRKTCPKHSG